MPMKTEHEIHPIQGAIVQKLLFSQKARFSELNTTKVSTDQFNFHLKALLDSGVIKKIDGHYELTSYGKEFANRFDTEKSQIEKQAKISVVLNCVRKVNGVTKYLLQQRLKQPYYGYHGAVGGKVRWGETVEEAAIREFKEETGLDAKVYLQMIKHKMDYSKTGELLEDKYFFVFKATVVGGKFISKFDGGKNIWLTIDEIKKLNPIFDDLDRSMKITRRKKLAFVQNKYTVSGF